MIHYHVKLTKSEVEDLQSIINKGSHTSQTFRTAYILLNCDEGEYSEKVTNEQISKVLKVGMRTIDRVKKKFLEEGFENSIERRPTTRIYDKKIDGDVEAKIVLQSIQFPSTNYIGPIQCKLNTFICHRTPVNSWSTQP